MDAVEKSLMVNDIGACIGRSDPPSRSRSPRYFRKKTDERRFGKTKQVFSSPVAR
jgi:hypothetical protein